MSDAPKRIWATPDNASTSYGVWDCAGFGDYGDRTEYHIARHDQPCSTDEFLVMLQASDLDPCQWHEVIHDWLRGDFDAAMEGLT